LDIFDSSRGLDSERYCAPLDVTGKPAVRLSTSGERVNGGDSRFLKLSHEEIEICGEPVRCGFCGGGFGSSGWRVAPGGRQLPSDVLPGEAQVLSGGGERELERMREPGAERGSARQCPEISGAARTATVIFVHLSGFGSRRVYVPTSNLATVFGGLCPQ
jgi:hypothetical protein